MAGEIELRANVFGDKALVAGLDDLRKQLRFRLFAELKSLARVYADDVAASGLAEQGIRSRTGNLRRNMIVRGRMSPDSARALVYPGARDERGYRYPWALGKGSPKNQVDVKPYVRAPGPGEVGGDVTLAVTRGGVRKGGKRFGARQRIEFKRFSGVVRVAAHHRRVNMKPRPFMSGGAFSRLESVFAAKMEAAVRAAVQHVTTTAQLEAGGFDGMGSA